MAESDGPRERHCASCDRDVHDASAFTRKELEDLIDRGEKKGTLCLHLHLRKSDGAILLADGHVSRDERAHGGLLSSKASQAARVALVGTTLVAAAAACSQEPSASVPSLPQPVATAAWAAPSVDAGTAPLPGSSGSSDASSAPSVPPGACSGTGVVDEPGESGELSDGGRETRTGTGTNPARADAGLDGGQSAQADGGKNAKNAKKPSKKHPDYDVVDGMVF